MLVPVGFNVGLTSTALGLVHACQQQGMNVGHFKPITQPSRNVISNKNKPINFSDNDKFISLQQVEHQMADGKLGVVLEELVANFNAFESEQDVIFIEGLLPTQRQPYASRINAEVAKALSAEIVLIAAPETDNLEEFEDRIDVSAKLFGGIKSRKLIGCIINKVNAPDKDEEGLLPRTQPEKPKQETDWQAMPIFSKSNFDLLGTIPWSINLIAPRVIDIADYLQAEVLHAGDMAHRRIRSVSFCARTVGNLVSHLQPSRLIVTPGDRIDILIATCLSALNALIICGFLINLCGIFTITV